MEIKKAMGYFSNGWLSVKGGRAVLKSQFTAIPLDVEVETEKDFEYFIDTKKIKSLNIDFINETGVVLSNGIVVEWGNIEGKQFEVEVETEKDFELITTFTEKEIKTIVSFKHLVDKNSSIPALECVNLSKIKAETKISAAATNGYSIGWATVGEPLEIETDFSINIHHEVLPAIAKLKGQTKLYSADGIVKLVDSLGVIVLAKTVAGNFFNYRDLCSNFEKGHMIVNSAELKEAYNIAKSLAFECGYVTVEKKGQELIFAGNSVNSVKIVSETEVSDFETGFNIKVLLDTIKVIDYSKELKIELYETNLTNGFIISDEKVKYLFLPMKAPK